MVTDISLQTPRLILREYQQSDFHGVHAYASDPATVKFMTWGPNTPADTQNFIDMAIAEQFIDPRINYYFVVAFRYTNLNPEFNKDQIIGGCGIHIQKNDPDHAYIGYGFNKIFWGEGYATEAAVALIRFGFDELGLRRICATCDTRNIASVHVLEKTGMRREWHKIKHIRQKGAWRDSYLYAILADEWQEQCS